MYKITKMAQAWGQMAKCCVFSIPISQPHYLKPAVSHAKCLTLSTTWNVTLGSSFHNPSHHLQDILVSYALKFHPESQRTCIRGRSISIPAVPFLGAISFDSAWPEVYRWWITRFSATKMKYTYTTFNMISMNCTGLPFNLKTKHSEMSTSKL